MRGRAAVLWVIGPPGAGKTEVGWRLYRRLAATGASCAYVDIDQLGMCYPEPPSDPGRYRLKEGNLRSVVANFAGAGAPNVIVSGIVDPARGADLGAEPGVDLTLCRLRADPERIRQRLEARNGPFIRLENALADAAVLDDSDFADAVVDTTDLTVEEVVGRVEEVTRWAPTGGTTNATGDRQPSPAGGRVLWLCGPSGAGKSIVGYTVFQRLVQVGVTAGFVDSNQIGFCTGAAGGHDLRAGNLAAIWENYRAAGASTLVVSGAVRTPGDTRVYEAMLPGASFAWFRLHAGDGELARRIGARHRGVNWPEPGDPIRGATPERLRQAVADAAAQAAELERAGLESAGVATRIDTEGLSVEESAGAVLRHAGGSRRDPVSQRR